MTVNTQVEIRKPKISELDEILPLWLGQSKFHHDIDSDYYTEVTENKEYLIKAIEKDDPYMFIAILDGKICGFITYVKAEADYFDTNIQKYGEVQELYVDPAFRSRGIGRALLTKTETELKKDGYTWVKLQCSTFNPQALKFYEREQYKDRQRLLFKEIK